MISRWAYRSVGRRDPRLDWLRGYCLFMMTVDHVGGPSSVLYAITGNTAYYTSAAEAFYFISGVTIGLISNRGTLRAAVRRVLSRALVLYRTGILLALTSGLIGLFTGLEFWGRTQFLERKPELWSFVFRTLTLRNEAGGAGILVLYVLFMVVAPLALWALSRRWAWAVLGVSVGLYALGQIAPGSVRLPFAVYFDPAAWQVLFFGGLVIGYCREEIAAFLVRVPRWRDALEWTVVILALAYLIVFANGWNVWPATPELLGPREPLRPARLVLVMLNLFAAYILSSWFWTPLRRGLGWLLEPLGRSSLWAFTTHYVAVGLIFNIPAFKSTNNIWLGAVWQLLAVLMVWASIRAYAVVTAPRRKTGSMLERP